MNIKPISDLRNYNVVLRDCRNGAPVFLTKNGRGKYVIMDAEQYDAMEAELRLVDTEDYIVSSAMNNFAFMNRNDLRFQFTNPEALYAYTEEELEILMAETAE